MKKSFLVTSLSIAAAMSSQAAIVASFQTSQTAGAAQSSVSTDLLQTSLSSSTWPTNNNINNGSTGAWNAATTQDPAQSNATGTWTFTLNTAAQPLGYDISQVNVFTGWVDGRAGQSYTLRFSVVGNSSFTDILTVSQAANNTGLVSKVFDDTGALLGTGVDEIQFVVTAPGGLASVYREIDVLPVPEPSVALIGGIGLLGLLTRRRR